MPGKDSSARSYGELCGIATAFDVIGDRWAALIVRDLLFGPLRFGELAEGLPGIGTNTLAARLKDLEESDVVRRQLLPLPDRGTVYELTSYGRELEPILMNLGRWGAKSMDRLPADVATRSRWLVAAMLAFRNMKPVARPTTWELRLSDGEFTVRAAGTEVTITAGPAEVADLRITAEDDQLHRLLTHRRDPNEAVASGAVSLEGDAVQLTHLLELFSFPAFDPTGAGQA
jgi:DNA-binding HxlR family transcriptional regulator